MLLYYNKSFFWLLLERRGSVFYRWDSLLGGVLIAGFGGLVQYLRDSCNSSAPPPSWQCDIAPEIQHHYGFQALGAGVTFAIVFRTQLAWNRYWEAVTQLHFMYSKWADAFSQFQAFAEVTRRAAKEKGDPKKEERIRQKQRRLKVNYALLSTVAADRLTSGDNQRMEEVNTHRIHTRGTMRIAKEAAGFQAPTMIPRQEFDRSSLEDAGYVVFEMPSKEQLQLLHKSNDTVSTVMYWIIWDLADAMKDIDVAPPIQSRMYQELSNGMPFAQLLGLLLMAFSLLIPIYVIVFTGSYVVGPILCFFLFESLWCLNEVAKELENPFGQDTNDISLTDFHMRFVDALDDVSWSEQQAMLRQNFFGADEGPPAPLPMDPAAHGVELLPAKEVGMRI